MLRVKAIGMLMELAGTAIVGVTLWVVWWPLAVVPAGVWLALTGRSMQNRGEG